MARYTYHGPIQSISIKTGTRKNDAGEQVSLFKDFDLNPNAGPVELPADNAVVKSMITAGLLRADKPKATSPKTNTKEDK